MHFIKLFFLMGLECFSVKTHSDGWKRILDSKGYLEWESAPFEESLKVTLYEAGFLDIGTFTMMQLLMLQKVSYPIEHMVSDYCFQNSRKDIDELWEMLSKKTIAGIILNYPDTRLWVEKSISFEFWRWAVNDHLTRVDYVRLLKTIQWLPPKDQSVAKCIIDKYAQ